MLELILAQWFYVAACRIGIQRTVTREQRLAASRYIRSYVTCYPELIV